MLYATLKVVLTSVLVVAVSEAGKRNTFLAAILASLPLVSVLAMIWLYVDTRDVEKVASLASGIFWLVLPSLVLFVTLPPSPAREATIRALWGSRLGVARMFSRAIADYPEIAPLLLPGGTPNARALAAGTITITTSALLSCAAEDAIVRTFEGFARAAS